MNQFVNNLPFSCQTLSKEGTFNKTRVLLVDSIYTCICYRTYLTNNPKKKFLPAMGSSQGATSPHGVESGYIKGLEIVLCWLKN